MSLRIHIVKKFYILPYLHYQQHTIFLPREKSISMKGTQVPSLVQELRSHMPQGNYWALRPQLESPCAVMKDPTWHNEDSDRAK